MRNNSPQADVVHNAGVIIHPVRTKHFCLDALSVPAYFWVVGAENYISPAVEDLDIDVFYKFIRVKRREQIVVAVTVGSKYVWKFVVRTIIHANNITVSTFIAE